ncbi:MAG: Nif3-like dinuclear metal center hexameric protein [Dialister sp.]|nr:Nif3-like dinuclear metal center hexameric protein [Dialister sp.]
MEVNAQMIMEMMNAWAPPHLAESWDRVGLQIGRGKTKVKKILAALDVTEDNVEYAATHGVNMIVSHHPFLFRPVIPLDTDTWKGRIIEKLIKHNIVSFAAHTNLDTAEGGVNDALAEALELTNPRGLVPGYKEASCKVVVYVEPMLAKRLSHALGQAFPGRVGRFYLLDDEDDFTTEARLEFNTEEKSLSSVKDMIAEMAGAPPMDIYRLADGGKTECMGRIGELARSLPGKEALLYVKEKLKIPSLRYCGNPDITVRRIAVLGGAGIEFFPVAKQAGADLYVTGDVKYHEAQEAAGSGLLVADGGHFYTERVIIPKLAKCIRNEAALQGWELEVIEDPSARDVFSVC